MLAVMVGILGIGFPALARIGVGIGSGKIIVDKPMKPGFVYDLPPVPVINTGDENSDYGLAIEYLDGQPQLKPLLEWFEFTPSKFSLEPGKVQTVGIKLSLPVKLAPGDYFAYLEAHPIVPENKSGATRINVAAATKLYFTIEPANIWQGIYYRMLSIYTRNSTLIIIIFSVLAAGLVLLILKRFLSFDIKLKAK